MTSVNKPTNDGKSGKQPSRKKAHLILAAITVVLLLLGAGVTWRIVWEWSQPSPTAETRPEAMVRAIERRLTLLENRVEDLEKAEDISVMIIESSERWWLVEVERYLVEAGERLRNGADVKSALSALKSARSTLESIDLQGADSMMIKAVEEIMDMEIRSLTGYKNYAAERAQALIDNILSQLERGVSLNEKPARADAPAPAGTDGVTWGWLVERFKRLVVFETQAAGEPQKLNRGLIVHSLMLAKVAIPGGDNRSYRYAVANAMRLFERSSAFDQAIYEDLQVLQTIDITPSPPSVDKALREIRLFAKRILP